MRTLRGPTRQTGLGLPTVAIRIALLQDVLHATPVRGGVQRQGKRLFTCLGTIGEVLFAERAHVGDRRGQPRGTHRSFERGRQLSGGRVALFSPKRECLVHHVAYRLGYARRERQDGYSRSELVEQCEIVL